MKNQFPPKSINIDSTIQKLSIACFLLFTLASNFSISLAQVGAYLGIALWLTQTHRSGNWGNTQTILLWPFAFYLIATIISIGFAVDPWMSVSQLRKFFLALIFFWTMNALGQSDFKGFFIWMGDKLKPFAFLKRWAQNKTSSTSDQAVEFLVTVLFVSAFFSACYGLFQAFTSGGELADRIQIRGTMSHVFTFSVILMMIGLLALSRQLFGFAREKWIYTALSAILLCLILTMTRQIWLSLFVVTSCLLLFKRKSLIIIPTLLAVSIFLFSPKVIQDRITSIADLQQYSNSVRFAMWEGGIDVVKDYPLTGCGYKCLHLIRDQYPQHPVLQEFYYNLHNNLVQIAVDSGLLGLGTWMGIWISYFVNLLNRLRKEPSDSSSRWVILGSGAAVLSFLIAGLFETSFYDSEVVMVLYFIMALPFVSFNTSQTAPSDPATPSSSQ